jgi:hypothetical protein
MTNEIKIEKKKKNKELTEQRHSAAAPHYQAARQLRKAVNFHLQAAKQQEAGNTDKAAKKLERAMVHQTRAGFFPDYRGEARR